MTIRIREATFDDAAAISHLVAGLAQHVLDDVEAAAAQAFLASLAPAATAERIDSPHFRYDIAEDDSGLCGVIALRDRTHVYHLFVRADLHGRSIARMLWRHARAASGADRFTVRSSLSAEPVYARFGFVRESPPQTANGLSFVPMRFPDM